jgi:hypothetical protein
MKISLDFLFSNAFLIGCFVVFFVFDDAIVGRPFGNLQK